MPDLVSLAVAAAIQVGIDAALFCRLIEAESNWQVDAVSPSGCLGLGQINPDVYRMYDYLEPQANLDKAAWILAWNVNYRRRDAGLSEQECYERAVASYNLGYMAVNRIIRKHGGGWRDHLPEATRGYVDKITGGAMAVGAMRITYFQRGGMNVLSVGWTGNAQCVMWSPSDPPERLWQAADRFRLAAQGYRQRADADSWLADHADAVERAAEIADRLAQAIAGGEDVDAVLRGLGAR